MKDIKQNQIKGQENLKKIEFNISDLQEIIDEEIDQLSLKVGKILVHQLLQEDVNQLCGERFSRNSKRNNYRHGSQKGFGFIGGQKVPLQKPRVRSKKGSEIELPIYNKLQDQERFSKLISRKLICGVSSRNYEEVIDTTAESFGIKRSSVSRHFKAATREELEKLMNRDLGSERWLVVYTDGKMIHGESIVAAVGVNSEGKKHILGFRQGGSENKNVVLNLLTDLRDRGLSADGGILFVIDGSKALYSAINEVFGVKAFIQRCRVHKRRNILDHVPKGQQVMIGSLLSMAYQERNIEKARKKLENLANKLDASNPDAANSLREGLEETLTVLRFNLPETLNRTLFCTNSIESMFSIAETLMRRVKRWRGGNMKKRWLGAGLLRAETRCNRIRGYRYLNELARAMKYEIEKKYLDNQEEIA